MSFRSRKNYIGFIFTLETVCFSGPGKQTYVVGEMSDENEEVQEQGLFLCFYWVDWIQGIKEESLKWKEEDMGREHGKTELNNIHC